MSSDAVCGRARQPGCGPCKWKRCDENCHLSPFAHRPGDTCALVPGIVPNWRVRGVLLLQIAIFLSMVSIHFGLLIGGYRHRSAGTVELVIAAALVAGLLLTWTPRPWSRRSAIAVQSFGILGVLLGLSTIALGIGPQTTLDLTLNAALLLSLSAGL